MHGSLYDFANLTITYYLLLFKEAIFSCGVVVALVRIVKVRWALVGAFFDELGLLHIHLPIRGTFSRHLITTSYSLESMFEDGFFDIYLHKQCPGSTRNPIYRPRGPCRWRAPCRWRPPGRTETGQSNPDVTLKLKQKANSSIGILHNRSSTWSTREMTIPPI